MDLRPAERGEYPALVALEHAADAMFADLGIVFPPGSVLDDPGPAHTVLVEGRPARGFIVTGPVDNGLHVHQLAVHPRHGRRGIGSALLAAAADPSEVVTLTTFADVPWNAPWYERRGFRRLPRSAYSPDIARIVEHERAAGLYGLGPRVVLYRPPRQDRPTGE